jgi:hypothetical protein
LGGFEHKLLLHLSISRSEAIEGKRIITRTLGAVNSCRTAVDRPKSLLERSCHTSCTRAARRSSRARWRCGRPIPFVAR